MRGWVFVLTLSLALALTILLFKQRYRQPPLSIYAVTSQAVSKSILPSPAPADAAPQPPPSSNQGFATLIENTFEELPRLAALRNLSDEEIHGTPDAIRRGGALLGEIAQAVHDHPELRLAAHHFYLCCAQTQDFLTPIRALCYSHLLGQREVSVPADIPEEIVRLARLIPQS